MVQAVFLDYADTGVTLEYLNVSLKIGTDCSDNDLLSVRNGEKLVKQRLLREAFSLDVAENSVDLD